MDVDPDKYYKMTDMPTKCCIIRIYCLSCLSSLTFFHEDLPVQQFRIRVRQRGTFKTPVPLGFYLFYMPYRVIDFENFALTKIHYHDLHSHDKKMQGCIDANKLLCDSLLPLNDYSQHAERFFIGYHIIIGVPRVHDLAIPDFPLTPEEQERKFELSNEVELYLKTPESDILDFTIDLRNFDKWNRSEDCPACFLFGHVVHYTKSDKIRKCYKCGYLFPSSKDWQDKALWKILPGIFEIPELF